MSEVSKLDINLISIVGMRTLRGNIEINNEEILKNLNELYHFGVKLDTNIEREKKLIRTIIEITIHNVTEEGGHTGLSGSYTNEFIFKVENIEDLVNFNEGERNAIISFELGITIASVTYSTMRGVIHTRTQGTVLDGIIIPVVEAKKLLEPMREHLNVIAD